MVKKLALVSFVAAAFFSSVVFAAEPIRISSWPDGVPCDALKRLDDGSWVQTKPVISGNMTMDGNVFRNTGETVVWEKKCGVAQNQTK